MVWKRSSHPTVQKHRENPILLRQRDHANQHDQLDRTELLTNLRDGIDNGPPMWLHEPQPRPHGSLV